MRNSVDTGPFLLSAVMGQGIIRDASGNPTGVSEMTASVGLKPDGSDPAAQVISARAELKVVVILVAGQGRGKHFTVYLQPETPDGTKITRSEAPMEFLDREDAMAFITVDYAIPLHQEGLHWIDVRLAPAAGGSSRLLTRMPLHVVYQPSSQ